METTQDRALATVRQISSLRPIQGADKIELAIVDGWQVVVKKGDFKEGELIVYLEIDSWVPEVVAPFLTKNVAKEYKGVVGNRLKTIKLRGERSQGLILPINSVGEFAELGDDVTSNLGILKWEKEIPAHLAGQVKGNFPSEIPKTKQERVQNLSRTLIDSVRGKSFEMTEKLHGTSATFFLDNEDVFHVCSRNLDLKETADNTYWQIARKYKLEENMRLCNLQGMAIQGEIVGPGINGNQYGLTEPELFVFDLLQVADSSESLYCPADIRQDIVAGLGLKHVPVITIDTFDNDFIDDKDSAQYMIEQMLNVADELRSGLNDSKAEGFVMKCIDNPEFSFKVVSNVWLENGGEDQ